MPGICTYVVGFPPRQDLQPYMSVFSIDALCVLIIFLFLRLKGAFDGTEFSPEQVILNLYCGCFAKNQR